MLMTFSLYPHKIYRLGRGTIKPELIEYPSKDTPDMEPGRFEYYNGVDAILIFLFPLGFISFNSLYWYYYMKL